MTLRIFNPDDQSQTLHGELLAAAFAEFDCGPVADSGRQGSRRITRAQARRRERVSQTCVEFTDLMLSPKAPLTEEEAVAMLTPTTVWLLQWFCQQLVIQVVKFLWRRWNERTPCQPTSHWGA